MNLPSAAMLIHNLQVAQRECEYLINSTPTSERRNAITDINMKLMMLLAEAKKLPKGTS